jgi:hypothetical protein
MESTHAIAVEGRDPHSLAERIDSALKHHPEAKVINVSVSVFEGHPFAIIAFIDPA